MSNSSSFIRADEVAADLDVSKAHAYKVIQRLNKELKEQGYMVLAGRVSRKYYQEKFYGISEIT